MTDEVSLRVEMTDRPVTLHYPGAEGVVFQDAVLVIQNDGKIRAVDVGVKMKVAQEEKALFDGIPDLTALGVTAALEPGEEAKASLFRILQKEVQGFGSRVNLFGYKVALNWTYDVSAVPVAGPGKAVVGEERRWRVRWHPSETDPNVVEVDIS